LNLSFEQDKQLQLLMSQSLREKGPLQPIKFFNSSSSYCQASSADGELRLQAPEKSKQKTLKGVQSPLSSIDKIKH
jgi:hypothetical protein